MARRLDNRPMIRLLVGRLLVERWELWRPALESTHGADVYPLFRQLAERMRRVPVRLD